MLRHSCVRSIAPPRVPRDPQRSVSTLRRYQPPRFARATSRPRSSSISSLSSPHNLRLSSSSASSFFPRPPRRYTHDHHHHHLHDPSPQSSRSYSDLLRIGLVAAGCALSWSQVIPYVQGIDLVAAATALGGGVPIYKEVYADLKEKRVTMAVSMSLGILASLLSQEYFTASLITFVVLVAEKLEHMVTARGKRAVQSLIDLLPRVAEKRSDDGAYVTTPINDLKIGDVILVRPGMTLPVDGVVVSGTSHVNEAAITGEPLPARKEVASMVYAGTQNDSGALEIRVSQIGNHTIYGNVLSTLQNASLKPAPIQRTADRMAKVLVLFALSAATLTYIATASVTAATSVVVVAGSCGIAVGTPLAIVAGIGRAAKSGAIIKGGPELEALAHVDEVIFDKTGTLTEGVPSVTQIEAVTPYNNDDVLRWAAIADMRSEHPLAKAVVKKAGDKGVLVGADVKSFTSTVGRGVECELLSDDVIRVGSRKWMEEGGVATSAIDGNDGGGIFVSFNKTLVGRLLVDDALRHDAPALTQLLKQRGMRQILLTGDGEKAANRVASTLNLDEVRHSQLPADKLAFVQQQIKSGRRVAMVGDGVNDALALAAANVSVALGTAADVSKQVASVVLIGNQLTLLNTTMKIAHRVQRIIQQNFWGTIACATIGMAFAATGVLPPVAAAVFHGASDIVWILNSSRAYAPISEK